MRVYSKVSPLVWRSERFMGLQSDDGKLLYLYLLTCEHQNSAGAFRLPDGYACVDLRWEPERYVKARAELIAADLIAFDEKASVVAIRRWFQHNPPMNEKHFAGTLRLLDGLQSDSIAQEVRASLTAAWDEKAVKTPCLPESKGIPSRLQTPFFNGRS
jgi:hypothetical protein